MSLCTFTLFFVSVSVYCLLSVLKPQVGFRFVFCCCGKAAECGPLNTCKATMPVTSLGLLFCLCVFYIYWFVVVCVSIVCVCFDGFYNLEVRFLSLSF